jgi:methanethiol S-methyltransferase
MTPVTVDPAQDHFGQWGAMIVWTLFFVVFLVFTPFYKKSQRKPTSVYIAFVLALALEMFGVPLTMYAITWALGTRLPEGVLWGHTLIQSVGLAGTYIMYGLSLVGAVLIIWGWRDIYKPIGAKKKAGANW